MSMRRHALLVASLAAPLALASCGKKKPVEQTQPPITPVAVAPGDDATPVVAEPAPAVERMVVTGSLEGLDDILATVTKISKSFTPDAAVDVKSELSASLMGMGFSPAFLSNIDLDGAHLLTVAAPPDGGNGPQDVSMSASVAVVDARKLIDAIPQSQRPSPLGEGMWEMAMDGSRLLMNEQGKELLLGFSTEDVSAAGSLRGKHQPGPRLRVRVSNIPTDDIDPAAVLNELPSDLPMVQEVANVLRELNAITLEADLGTTRDMQAQIFAEAPFSKLGLGPIGAARGASTALEARLPGNPIFVTTLSWGDPALLHKMIDGAPIGQVPDALRGMVEKAIANTHAILDQIASDVVLALYLNKKGQATFVMAADIRDDAKAKAALQGIHEVMAQGVTTQATMAGKNKDKALVGKLELNGLKVPGGKADRMTVTVPKGFIKDVRAGKMFLRKNALDVISHVDENTAILAIGAGGRGLVTDVAKNLGKARKNSLAQDAGLEGVRKAMGGCQICMSGDPLGYLRFRLILMRDDTDDKVLIKEANKRMGTVGKVPSLGLTGAGIKVESERGGVGITIPQASLFAPPESVKTFGQILDFLSDPEFAIAEAEEEKKSSKKSSKKK